MSTHGTSSHGGALLTARPGESKDSNESQVTREFRLEMESELRIDVDHGHKFEVRLVEGTAEVFGAELNQNPYAVEDVKLAIFTWTGCVLEVSGVAADMLPDALAGFMYEENASYMRDYVSLHADLEKMREVAAKDKTKRGNGHAAWLLR